MRSLFLPTLSLIRNVCPQWCAFGTHFANYPLQGVVSCYDNIVYIWVVKSSYQPSCIYTAGPMVSMERPNVNWKFHDLYQAHRLDEHSTSFLNVGSCGLHIVHGAFQTGIADTGWKIDRFFQSCYWLFSDTQARRDDFIKVIQSDMFPLRFCKHRWLDIVPVAECTLELLPQLRFCVEAIKKKELPNPATSSYEHLAESLDDPLLEVKINTFLSIAKCVSPFLTLYQSEKPMMPFLAADLASVMKGLMNRVVKKDLRGNIGKDGRCKLISRMKPICVLY